MPNRSNIERTYEFIWIFNESKYDKGVERHNRITIANPTGETKYDAKAALDIFIQVFGNLNRNKIVCIKEFDEGGNQVGEDIVPSEENAIIPEKRKEK